MIKATGFPDPRKQLGIFDKSGNDDKITSVDSDYARLTPVKYCFAPRHVDLTGQAY